MAPKGDSRDLTSATSPATDNIMTHGTPYFDFLALPRELRDMVYDQFQRLHPDTPMSRQPGRPVLMISHRVTSKPVLPLLLMNKRIGSEYRDACEKRFGAIVSSEMRYLDPAAELTEEIHPRIAQEAFFIHMHAGDWMSRLWSNNPPWTLSSLGDWVAHWSAQMPKLDSITVSIYLSLDSAETNEEFEKLEEALGEFVSLPKLVELKVITMNDGIDWRTERGPSSKKLLVHWTPSVAHKPTFIRFPKSYVETCCECLKSSSSDSDHSSSHSDDGNDNDDDSESDDDNNDSGDGSHGDTHDCDEENAENEDEDDDEDSDETGCDGADTSRNSEDNQAASYFDFFGLPPEIRDMIYDQPEMLDQETPLYVYDDQADLFSADEVAATTPRTSLLMVKTIQLWIRKKVRRAFGAFYLGCV
jgi:hypothetical protein